MKQHSVDHRRVNREVWQSGLARLMFTPEPFIGIVLA